MIKIESYNDGIVILKAMLESWVVTAGRCIVKKRTCERHPCKPYDDTDLRKVKRATRPLICTLKKCNENWFSVDIIGSLHCQSSGENRHTVEDFVTIATWQWKILFAKWTFISVEDRYFRTYVTAVQRSESDSYAGKIVNNEHNATRGTDWGTKLLKRWSRLE